MKWLLLPEVVFGAWFLPLKKCPALKRLVSGEPLFSTLEQYDAGCGWPSFTKPLHPENIKEKDDYTHGLIRTEVRSTGADSRRSVRPRPLKKPQIVSF
jgi:peptide methionine sulfoxide reductase MsrB